MKTSNGHMCYICNKNGLILDHNNISSSNQFILNLLCVDVYPIPLSFSLVLYLMMEMDIYETNNKIF